MDGGLIKKSQWNPRFSCRKYTAFVKTNPIIRQDNGVYFMYYFIDQSAEFIDENVKFDVIVEDRCCISFRTTAIIPST